MLNIFDLKIQIYFELNINTVSIVSRLIMRLYDAKTNNTMNQQTVTKFYTI